MKLLKIIVVMLAVMVLNGCGDQMYCGDDGCNHSSQMFN